MKQRRNRKNCKHYRQRGKVTAYCDFLGNGLLCYKVCNMFECKHSNIANSDDLDNSIN